MQYTIRSTYSDRPEEVTRPQYDHDTTATLFALDIMRSYPTITQVVVWNEDTNTIVQKFTKPTEENTTA